MSLSSEESTSPLALRACGTCPLDQPLDFRNTEAHKLHSRDDRVAIGQSIPLCTFRRRGRSGCHVRCRDDPISDLIGD